ncbi:hypothetical protein CUT44_14080 [Streptomyces carminius]|uniref:Uncharacterized protein n=1 Tax=Streptomyces carminius TaxID=2665496 RepID=A0A2M8LYP9_9ACTN|nr:hypothetical protein [Streptomyces carminius]PJE97108.1 hypothetical protein CUT44_14080 [Streptomyces carminius]
MSRTRGTWNTKGIWLVGAALAAVLALTGYVLLGGDEDGSDTSGKGGASPSGSASAAPTYKAPEQWTEPERWTALPRGERTDDRGSAVGFPRTTEGAVAMAAAANTTTVEADRSNVDEQLRIYHSYLSEADRTGENAEAVELNALQTDKMLRKQMGVGAGQPLPSGAYVRNYVVGYQVVTETDGEVGVWLLTRVTQKTGELEKESSSYTRTLAGVVWEGGDWKLSAAATERAQHQAQTQGEPEMVAPGDAEFNAAGWTAIREAS